MKSIGARLAFWYALASTATLACLFLAGRYFLEQHAIHALDLINASEFDQVKARLGSDFGTATAETVRERMRETGAHASVLFYIEIHAVRGGLLYRSNNLQGQAIPRLAGRTAYNAPSSPKKYFS